MALRWGIASTGKIAHDFVNCLTSIDAEIHDVVAVAARGLDRAKEFAQEFNIKKAYEGYLQLGTDPDIEIVYIAVLNPQHYEVAKMMLENGKHILVEKPLCLNYKQTKSLIDLAKSKKLFLMEAAWSRFFPSYSALRKEIDSGTIGDVLYVSSCMGLKTTGFVERIRKKDLGGGTIMDQQIYTLQLAQFVFKDYPEDVKATGELNEDGVDIMAHTILRYSGARTVVMSTHTKVDLPNEAYIVGTKGTIKLHAPFWKATKMTIADGKVLEFSLPEARFPFNFSHGAGLSYEAKECRRCIREGLTESPGMPQQDSLNMSRIEDAIRAQIGVKFSADD